MSGDRLGEPYSNFRKSPSSQHSEEDTLTRKNKNKSLLSAKGRHLQDPKGRRMATIIASKGNGKLECFLLPPLFSKTFMCCPCCPFHLFRLLDESASAHNSISAPKPIRVKNHDGDYMWAGFGLVALGGGKVWRFYAIFVIPVGRRKHVCPSHIFFVVNFSICVTFFPLLLCRKHTGIILAYYLCTVKSHHNIRVYYQ